jgi:hypothetical protein
MSRELTTVVSGLLLVFLLVALVGAVGCGGAAKKDDDDDDDTPQVFDLRGRVLDNGGAPIGDAAIEARTGDAGGALLDSATTLADGSYLLRIPGETPFYLHAEKAAYADTNSHIRELTADRIGVDVVLLFENQADGLLASLGGPTSFSPANLLFDVRSLTPAGLERTGVTVTMLPIGLTLKYRQGTDGVYSDTGPTVACTAPGGCQMPHMAGYSGAVNQGIYTFRMVQTGVGDIATVAAPLRPGEVTFVVND